MRCALALLALLLPPALARASDCYFQDWQHNNIFNPAPCPGTKPKYPDQVPDPPNGAVWVPQAPRFYRAMQVFRRETDSSGATHLVPVVPGINPQELPTFMADPHPEDIKSPDGDLPDFTTHLRKPMLAPRFQAQRLPRMTPAVSRPVPTPALPKAAPAVPVATAAPPPTPTPTPKIAAPQADMASAQAAALQSRVAAERALGFRDYNQAVVLAGRSLEAAPTADAYLIRASAFNGAGAYPQALDDAGRGLLLAPGEPSLLAAQAFALNHLGRYREAYAAADASVRAKPEGRVYAIEAFALAHLGDQKGMIEALRKAAAIDPEYKDDLDQAEAAGSIAPAARTPDFSRAAKAPAENDAGDSSGGFPFWLVILCAAVVGAVIAGFVAKLVLPKPRTVGAQTPRARYRTPVPTPAGAARTTAGGSAAAGPQTASGKMLRGRYELRSKIGSGGMGDVYDAFEHALGRRVAIKKMREEIKADPDSRATFLREASIVSHLSHPYIVAIHEVIEEAGDIYLVFDFVDGQSLYHLLQKRKRLPLAEVQKLFSYVCEAISCAHRAHILHRDLKPANIMVDKDGYAKVMDFGIAFEAKQTITRLTMADASGTPAYMAPEQHLGHGGKASDIFSLGVCLYEAMTGQLPFPGPDFLSQKERKKYPPPQYLNPELPKEAELLFAATLSPDPKLRVDDAAELIEILKSLKA